MESNDTAFMKPDGYYLRILLAPVMIKSLLFGFIESSERYAIDEKE